MIVRYSEEEIKFIKDNYKTVGNKKLGEILGRSADGIKHQLERFGLRRTKKQVKQLRKNYNTGQFKKGNIPHNTRYNGHERLTKDGYIMMRIKKGKYVLKHLYLWEKVNGKLPDSHCLYCIDGNKLNTQPSNWKLISRTELMLRNSRYDYPEEVLPSLVLINKLKNKLNSINHG